MAKVAVDVEKVAGVDMSHQRAFGVRNPNFIRASICRCGSTTVEPSLASSTKSK
jgi:hypothetical protein